LIEIFSNILDEIMCKSMERFSDDKWEIGDQECIVYNDAVVILELKDHGPSVEIIAGEYIKVNKNTNLVD
jgi:hypothetical protein